MIIFKFGSVICVAIVCLVYDYSDQIFVNALKKVMHKTFTNKYSVVLYLTTETCMVEDKCEM